MGGPIQSPADQDDQSADCRQKGGRCSVFQQAPQEWSVLQGYMAGEAAVAGLDVQRLRELCGGHNWQHWFSRSQFCLIPQQQYQTLQKSLPGQFCLCTDTEKNYNRSPHLSRPI